MRAILETISFAAMLIAVGSFVSRPFIEPGVGTEFYYGVLAGSVVVAIVGKVASGMVRA